MRLSTPQMFHQGVDALLEQQALLHHQELKLATGKRILTPSDDPSGAVKAATLTQKISEMDQFARNIGEVEYQLGLQENAISGVVDGLQRIRQLTVQGNVSSLPASARTALAKEMEQRLAGMIDLANSKDAAGESIFGGFAVDAAPFSSRSGQHRYAGDEGQRFLRIGEASQVAVRESGMEVFEKVRTGNGDFVVEPASSNQGSVLAGQTSVDGDFIEDTYTIAFTQLLATDPVTYTVTDSSATVLASGSYASGDSLEFAGARIEFSGAPVHGDQFTVAPSGYQSLFNSVQEIIDSLRTPITDESGTTRFHNSMARSLDNLDQALGHLEGVRASIGAKLNRVEVQTGMNDSLRVQLQTTLSETMDLDYADAITQFNLQLTALKVAQQSYVQTQGLSLFDYL